VIDGFLKERFAKALQIDFHARLLMAEPSAECLADQLQKLHRLERFHDPPFPRFAYRRGNWHHEPGPAFRSPGNRNYGPSVR
jgi:hypothetical protein